jgi:hypothetical protein
MCNTVGPNFNRQTEKANSQTGVDRSNKAVPVPPADAGTPDAEPAFGNEHQVDIDPANQDEGKALKNIKLCSYEPEDPGIYQCVAKVDPEGKDDPQVYQCVAKIGDDKDPSQGIYQCVAKVEHEPFEHIRLRKTELKELFKTDKADPIEVKPEKKENKPEIYNCTYKLDPDKKDNKPEFYNCTFKIDPNKKDDKPGIYNCTYKIETDDNKL